MTKRVRVPGAMAALVTMIALAVSACSGNDQAESSQSDGSSESHRVTGDGYSYELPEGWSDVAQLGSEAPPNLQRELTLSDSVAVADPNDAARGVANVVTGPAPPNARLQVFARDARRAIMDPATAPPGVSFTAPPTQPAAAELGGVEAMRFDHRGRLDTPGQSGEYSQRQLLAIHKNTYYVATFGLIAQGATDEAADTQAIDEIAASWQWESG